MSKKSADADEPTNPYAGRWIAELKGKVIGQGGTANEAQQAAKAAWFKEKPEISYMPMNNELQFPELLEQIKTAIGKQPNVYLVGGSVRDAILQKPSKDLDFALAGDALKLARKVANAMGGAYYRLDDEHQAGRVILTQADETTYVLDFAKFRGEDLEADLKARDFTINALAVALDQPQELIDPTGGVADLHNHTLRACSAQAFVDDPLRILRAIRFAASYQLRIESDTKVKMRAVCELLNKVSPERIRDEIFRILDCGGAATSIRALEMLGTLPNILPELVEIKDVEQSDPHVYAVWEHTLQTLKYLEKIYAVLSNKHDPDKVADLHFGLTVMKLGRYRDKISEHLKQKLTRERNLLPLLFLACLYHDVGKAQTSTVEADGRIRFINHENIGAKIVSKKAEAMNLSTNERDYLVTIVRNHMRPRNFGQDGKMPTRRAVYRFFRDCGAAGIDICLLSLADVMGAYATTLTKDGLELQLDIIRTMLEAYWENYDKAVSPAQLIDGADLIKEFGLAPGPVIGELLEVIREGQVESKVETRGDALKLAEEWLASDDRSKT